MLGFKLIVVLLSAILPIALGEITANNPQLASFVKEQFQNIKVQQVLSDLELADFSTSNAESPKFLANFSSVIAVDFSGFKLSEVSTDFATESLSFALNYERFAVSLNYSLDGVSSLSPAILLQGAGTANLSLIDLTLVGKATIRNVNGTGKVFGMNLVSIWLKAESSFDGIVGEEFILDLIQPDLDRVAEIAFDVIIVDVRAEFKERISDYLNTAFEETPAEEILHTLVLDSILDLASTGWTVKPGKCEYYEELDFSCDGELVNNPSWVGSGFWMSCKPPSSDMCTFRLPVSETERIKEIRLKGWHSNSSASAMVEIWHTGDSQYSVYRFVDGVAAIQDKPMTGLTFYPMTYQPGYAVIDTLKVIYSVM